MINKEMLRCALGAIVIATAGCGGSDSGDGNHPNGDGGEPPATCGNGSCDSGETCTNCNDCTCPSGQTCSGDTNACVTDTTPRCGDGTCAGPTDPISPEDCTTCAQDCGCGMGQACLGETHVCGNPLIERMPGRWDLVELNGQPPPVREMPTVTVDAANPNCSEPTQTSGDACVMGFNRCNLILYGTRLSLTDAFGTCEGAALEDGHRVEYDATPTGSSTTDHLVFVRSGS